jgi:hypothetical protein
MPRTRQSLAPEKCGQRLPPDEVAHNSASARGVMAPKATSAPGAIKPTGSKSAPDNTQAPAK